MAEKVGLIIWSIYVCIHLCALKQLLYCENYTGSLQYNAVPCPQSQCKEVWLFCCASEMKGGKRGKRLDLKCTPSLEPRTLSKNHIQARVTVLWSTQPCSVLAQGSGIKITAKKREVIMGLG